MRPKHLIAGLVWLALTLPASSVHAGGVVSACNETNLKNALSGGGSVTFTCSGTITLTSTITIAASTTIDGSGQMVTLSGNNRVRVLAVNPGITFNLNGVTVANGSVDSGGAGILNLGQATVSNSTFNGNSAGGGGGGIGNGGTLKVSNSTFSDNSGVNGAGISNNAGGFATVTGSTFSGNNTDTSGDGGGIYNEGTLTVGNSTFSGNSARGGGGILNYGGTLTVSHSIFTGNSASDRGGGINSDNSNGTVILSNSTFSDNSATSGGAMSSGSVLTISGSAFSSNTATGIGGAIWNVSLATVSNSTFSGNSATSSGGAIHMASGYLTASNSTFSGNGASAGGGIWTYYYDPNPVTLKNTIVANSPTGGNCSGPIAVGGHNLSDDDSCSADIKGDARLGALQNNGGPTQTMALGPGSAAMDAADDAICAASPVNNRDQRGFIRPHGPQCDIGAYEAEAAPPSLTFLPIIRR